MHWIDQHHQIDELRDQPDTAFCAMKRYLVIGVRKGAAVWFQREIAARFPDATISYIV